MSDKGTLLIPRKRGYRGLVFAPWPNSPEGKVRKERLKAKPETGISYDEAPAPQDQPRGAGATS